MRLARLCRANRTLRSSLATYSQSSRVERQKFLRPKPSTYSTHLSRYEISHHARESLTPCSVHDILRLRENYLGIVFKEVC